MWAEPCDEPGPSGVPGTAPSQGRTAQRGEAVTPWVWAEPESRPSPLAPGGCRRLAARAPRTAASPRGATRHTPEASPPNAGSIDTSQGDEFGSLLSLPPSHAPLDQGPCSCSAPEGPGSEYMAPAALRHLYDTPRSLFQGPSLKDQASLPSPRPTGAEVRGGASTDPIPKLPAPQSQGRASDWPDWPGGALC